MKIGIIGPGSIGLLLACLLHKAGAAITLIDYKKERAEKLNKNGIILEDSGEQFHQKIPVICGFTDINNFDLLIICVKAYHTKTVADELNRAGFINNILTLQNGMGNVEILQNIIKTPKIIAGITSEGANLAKAGHIIHAGKGKTSFGSVIKDNPDRKFLNELADVMNKAGLETEISDDVDSLIWSKLLINVGINALTAILNIQNGKLTENNSSRDLMCKLVTEAWELAKLNGIKLPYDDPVKKTEEVCKMTAENYSSMNQDIKFGRKTEIDYINGAIVDFGKKSGLKCPYNDTATQIIHAMELLK